MCTNISSLEAEKLLNSLSNRILTPWWWWSVGGIIVCSERGTFFSFYSCCWILISRINKNKLPSYCSHSPFDSWLDLLQIHPFGNENGINTFLMHSSGILSPCSILRPPRSSFSEWRLITCPSSAWMRYNFQKDHLPWLTGCSVSLWIFILFLILNTWSQTWYLSEERNSRWYKLPCSGCFSFLYFSVFSQMRPQDYCKRVPGRNAAQLGEKKL